MNARDDWNEPHSHVPVAIAGCYYIATGFDDDTASGVRFLNPGSPRVPIQTDVTGKSVAPLPPYTGQWSSDSLGRAGSLGLWPGRLEHWVPPHTGPGERVSIAFNVELSLH